MVVVKDIEMFVSLMFLFIGVISMFNARFIVKKRLYMFDENKAVKTVKILSYITCVVTLVFIYLNK